MKSLLVLIFLLFATPAQAFPFNESAQSYYARQMKSCEYKEKRTSVWDLFSATREDHFDQCCVDSVNAMKKTGAKRIAADADCPKGQTKKSLPCATSKHWCVSVQ